LKSARRKRSNESTAFFKATLNQKEMNLLLKALICNFFY